MDRLGQYLERIGYVGSHEPTLQTLTAIHRAHLLSIPYENLDIHLGRKLTLDPDQIFQKLVVDQRGGWCYEMNGLLAWALRDLGFEVKYLAGAVPRASAGPNAEGNHLVLLVSEPGPHPPPLSPLSRPKDGPGEGMVDDLIDGPEPLFFLADVGFGDGFLEPIPFAEGTYVQHGFEFRLERGPEPGRWTMHNHQHGAAPTFDFGLETYEMSHFQPRCEWLQTSPESSFVRTPVCQRPIGQSILTLRGAIMTTITTDGKHQHTVETEAEYAQVLRDCFGLNIDTALLWTKVWQRHQEWMLKTQGEKVKR